MMEYLKETTQWDNPAIPNHTYILDRGKMIGYIKADTEKPIMFKKPGFFDRKGRTFKRVNINESN